MGKQSVSVLRLQEIEHIRHQRQTRMGPGKCHCMRAPSSHEGSWQGVGGGESKHEGTSSFAGPVLQQEHSACQHHSLKHSTV